MSAKKMRAYVDRCIGPRVVGGVYKSGYWDMTYEVLFVDRGEDGGGWWVTEKDITGPDPGRVRTHCTSWDARRDKVISLPG